MAKGFARKKLLYVLAGFVVVVLLGCVVLALALDGIAKAGIEKVGASVTGVTMKVNAVHVSLLHGRFVIEGFEMGNPQGFTSPHCFSAGRIEVDANLRSVFGKVLDLPLIEIDKPQVTLQFSGVQTNLGTLRNQMKPSGRQMRIGVVRITGASAQVAGLPAGKAASIPVPKIELTDLSTGGQSKSPAELAAAVLTAVEQAVLKAVRGVLSGEQLGALAGAAGQAVQAGEQTLQKGAAGMGKGAGEVKKGLQNLLGK